MMLQVLTTGKGEQSNLFPALVLCQKVDYFNFVLQTSVMNYC